MYIYEYYIIININILKSSCDTLQIKYVTNKKCLTSCDRFLIETDFHPII